MRERRPAIPPPTQGSTRGAPWHAADLNPATPPPTQSSTRAASAVRYEGAGAPRVVASGRGHVAERIVAVAREHGIAVRQDPVLAEALAALEIDTDVPPELYRAVAEALVWAYRLQRRSIPGASRR